MTDDLRPRSKPVSNVTRSRLLIISAIVLIASLVAVLVLGRNPFSSHPTSSPTTQGNPQAAPADKQIVRILDLGPNSGDLLSIDPAQINALRSYDKMQLVFPPLITIDDNALQVDWAAERHEVSGDGLTWTFHLHPGMRWSDGAPIDANTYAYSMNRSLDPCLASSVASYLYNIKGAKEYHDPTNCRAGVDGLTTTGSLISRSIVVTDPLTLKLTLGAPASYFLGALTYPTSWAVPKQLIDRYGQNNWTDHLADGAGFGGNLYKVTRWDHAGHFALAANTTFWGQKPIIQKVEWTLYKNQDTAWFDFKSGVGDVGIPAVSDLPYARTLPGYAEVPALYVYFLRVNWALAPFDDVRVRNAFSLAIDRKAVTRSVDEGGALPTLHMIIQGLPGYNPKLKNAAGDAGDKTNEANMTKARELAQAYAAEKCGGDFAKCAPVVYTFPTTSQVLSLQAQVFQQQWQTAFPGWQITVQGISRDLEISTFAHLQIAYDIWGADYPDPQEFTSFLWAKDAAFNQSAVDVPAADALEQRADVSSDSIGRLALYQQAEQLLVDQGAFIVYEQPYFRFVVRPSSKLMKWRLNMLGMTSPMTYQLAYVAA